MRAVLIEAGGVAVEVVDDRVFNRPVLLFGPTGNLRATPSGLGAWCVAGHGRGGDSRMVLCRRERGHVAAGGAPHQMKRVALGASHSVRRTRYVALGTFRSCNNGLPRRAALASAPDFGRAIRRTTNVLEVRERDLHQPDVLLVVRCDHIHALQSNRQHSHSKVSPTVAPAHNTATKRIVSSGNNKPSRRVGGRMGGWLGVCERPRPLLRT
jgi:hypothetical protein